MHTNEPLYSDFQKLFRLHHHTLCMHAYKYLADSDESQDAVQEVFVKFWEIKKEMVNDKNALYYLITAVRNNCISRLRKKVHTISMEDEVVSNQITDTPAEEDKKENTDIQALVDEALALLPPKCGAIFRMSRIDKLTYQQIANELGISIKTVENQMGKAIGIMREFARTHYIPFSILFSLIFFIGHRGIPNFYV
ncbi:RNA polymerase sigma-70 factor (ECF subfamily) [Pedobacter cryoconitis]|uniref:RNA polymerase sigma-70 factor n=1 Tax=Pedobacter cryoconitis TaxID=188932 RepID=UPI00160EE9C2|nr:RNA polymerase sigma-70 factor [Pedobacter cryoconitis]MBB6273935.1 RNA polymerase sigma-70 factor (ECF subfamily) [Pedobacter cryoconitis]